MIKIDSIRFKDQMILPRLTNIADLLTYQIDSPKRKTPQPQAFEGRQNSG